MGPMGKLLGLHGFMWVHPMMGLLPYKEEETRYPPFSLCVQTKNKLYGDLYNQEDDPYQNLTILTP
jgi:hypothetical protein